MKLDCEPGYTNARDNRDLEAVNQIYWCTRDDTS